MTFGEYLENVKFRIVPGDTADANQTRKTNGSKLKTTFTEPGCVGERFRPHYDNLMSRLELSPQAKIQADRDIFKGGQCFMLPSFFHLILHLQKEKREFSIAFRSFGTEVNDVAKEFNLFCEGKHPLFPRARADGTQETKDLRIEFPRSLASFRNTAEEGMTLTLGSLKPGKENGEQVIGFANISGWFHANLGGRTLGIRDFYPWWFGDHESDTSGKLLLVDPDDPTVHEVFFDDNIERDRAHIVNVRNAKTGEPIPFAQTNHRHLVKAEPYLAITDPNYFIGVLQSCEKVGKGKF